MRSRTGARVRNVLGHAEDVPWLGLVLTIPEELYRYLLVRSARRTAEKWATAIVEAWIVRWCFRGRPVTVGGSMSWHPEREQRPGVWSPHLNVLVPLRGLRDDGAAELGRFWLPPEALDDLHRRWTLALRFMGYSGPWIVQAEKRFYLSRGRAKDKSKDPRSGAARYYHRPFPGWKPSITRVRYFGDVARWATLPGHEPIRWPNLPSPCVVCASCGGPMRHNPPTDSS